MHGRLEMMELGDHVEEDWRDMEVNGHGEEIGTGANLQ
jgi:hypothetical protein